MAGVWVWGVRGCFYGLDGYSKARQDEPFLHTALNIGAAIHHQ